MRTPTALILAWCLVQVAEQRKLAMLFNTIFAPHPPVCSCAECGDWLVSPEVIPQTRGRGPAVCCGLQGVLQLQVPPPLQPWRGLCLCGAVANTRRRGGREMGGV